MKLTLITRSGGLLLTDPRYVRTVDAIQVELPMHQTVMEKIGKPIVLNIFMLGAVVALTGTVRRESVMKMLDDRIPPGLPRNEPKGPRARLRPRGHGGGIAGRQPGSLHNIHVEAASKPFAFEPHPHGR